MTDTYESVEAHIHNMIATGKKVNYKAVCVCGDEKILRLDPTAYLDWVDGEYVQDAFPDLSADDRERLVTGTCPTCWDEMFGEEE